MVELARNLIKIYPWLEDGELDEWRDRVEEICKCVLPCVNCNGDGDTPDFDPDTMVWMAEAFHCEEVDTKWVTDQTHCEDDGVTTTVAPVTTTFVEFSTTMSQGQDCRNSVNFIYLLRATGPNEIPFRYVDCLGIQRYDTFIKGQGKCLTFIAGSVFPTNPQDEVYFTASKFSIGIYECGVNDF